MTSLVETLLCDDVDLQSTNEVEVLIIVSVIHVRAHNQLNSGVCPHSRVCAGVCESVTTVLYYKRY